jgi:chromosomal replication initiation ATPase DnaA
MTIWEEVLAAIRRRGRIPPEDFRRWFNETAYASDSGDQITVWVPTESIRRHIAANYREDIDAALGEVDRAGTQIRFVVTGVADDEEDDDD